ncbi:MAG: SH3 beta-barrel fold-containing protein [Planctomycetota bacterium]
MPTSCDCCRSRNLFLSLLRFRHPLRPMELTQTRPVHQIPFRRALEFLYNETQGRIFSVYFRKTDGTMREMVCRRGVKAHLRGGNLPYDPKPKLLLPVFDMWTDDYRMVNLRTLVSFNIGGETFIIV